MRFLDLAPFSPYLNWCKEHRKWLVAGGEDPISLTNYYNSVFVVGPDGAIAFQQAKCVPVQFMKDGLPAREQHLWNSPWGKLGFGICYDASYTRVTDELMRQGAQALIFPTMDNTEWGKAEHELHGRIAPMRAAEYAVPVFRLCSSGISQFAGRDGRVLSSAPFPGQDAMCAQMELPPRGRMPLDRPLAELCGGGRGRADPVSDGRCHVGAPAPAMKTIPSFLPAPALPVSRREHGGPANARAGHASAQPLFVDRLALCRRVPR
jgi:hypothetical protein